MLKHHSSGVGRGVPLMPSGCCAFTVKKTNGRMLPKLLNLMQNCVDVEIMCEGEGVDESQAANRRGRRVTCVCVCYESN